MPLVFFCEFRQIFEEHLFLQNTFSGWFCFCYFYYLQISIPLNKLFKNNKNIEKLLDFEELDARISNLYLTLQSFTSQIVLATKWMQALDVLL